MNDASPSSGEFSRLWHPFALHPERDAGDVDAKDLAVCRQIAVLAILLIFSFWAVYRLTDPSHVDPLWSRVLFALVPASLAVGSYGSAAVRRHVITVWRVFLYVTVAWITVLTAVNSFDPSYAIGLLFVVAATGTGFGIGVRRRGPTRWFLAWATGLPTAALLMVESPQIDAFIFFVSLVSLAIIFYLILDWRIRAESALRSRRKEAETASRLKTTILRNLDHEFRTPLTSVLGFSETLQEELSGSQKQRAQVIHRSGARLQRTLDTLIALSRIRADRQHLAPELIDVAKCAAEAAEPFVSRAQEQGLDLTLELPDAPIEVEVNPEALGRIVAVLTDNAIKFTEEGSVVVSVKARDGMIVIKVKDTGIGMAEEARSRLFEPFRQASEGVNRTEEGLGLGLTLVGQLVEMLDGEIDVDSELGVGTKVEVRVPCAPDDRDTIPTHNAVGSMRGTAV